MTRVERMWINQPSSLQPLHRLHGTNVFATDSHDQRTKIIYFLSGDTISQHAPRFSLSSGWINQQERKGELS